jgi:hypothetical protein
MRTSALGGGRAVTTTERAAYHRLQVELARLRDEATTLRHSLWDLQGAVEDLRLHLAHRQPINHTLLRDIVAAAGRYRETLGEEGKKNVC